jgi:hypothetical protein
MLTRSADRTQMLFCDFFLSLLVSPVMKLKKCEDKCSFFSFYLWRKCRMLIWNMIDVVKLQVYTY